MATILGIDYGGRRIGVATGDTSTRIALPLTTLAGRDEPTRDARIVADFAAQAGADAFVVGLPLNMDGSAGPQAHAARRFASELERLSARPAYLHDERLSSVAANEALDAADVQPRDRKSLIDRIAAQKILQSWFDAGSAAGPSAAVDDSDA